MNIRRINSQTSNKPSVKNKVFSCFEQMGTSIYRPPVFRVILQTIPHTIKPKVNHDLVGGGNDINGDVILWCESAAVNKLKPLKHAGCFQEGAGQDKGLQTWEVLLCATLSCDL